MPTPHDEKGDIETGVVVCSEPETEASIHHEYVEEWERSKIAEIRIHAIMWKMRALQGRYLYKASHLDMIKTREEKWEEEEEKKPKITPEDVQCCKYTSMLIAVAIIAAVVITYLAH